MHNLLGYGRGVVRKSEGAGGCYVGNVMRVGQGLSESLASDKLMRTVDSVGKAIALCRIHRHELVAFTEFKGAKNTDVSSWAALFAHTSPANQVHKWARASIEDR